MANITGIENKLETKENRDAGTNVTANSARENTEKRRSDHLAANDASPATSIGPDSMYVKLIASDGHEFIIKRSLTEASKTISTKITGSDLYGDDEVLDIHFKDIQSHVLQKVSIFMQYKQHYTNCTTEIPDFPIPPEMALELLIVSTVLDM